MHGDRFFRFDGRTCVRAALGTGGPIEDEETGMTEDTHFLDTQQAARFLGLSAKTLARYRVSGDGPVFHRFGNRIRYRRAALDAWADERERVSTVDDGGDRPGAGG